MSAPRMLAHLNDGFRMASGELPTERDHSPLLVLLRVPPLNWLAACHLPFRQGLPTAPELIARTPDDWHTEMHRLRTNIAQFPSRHGTWAEHPFFGRLPASAWGRLGYRHMDHHLRQFGA